MSRQIIEEINYCKFKGLGYPNFYCIDVVFKNGDIIKEKIPFEDMNGIDKKLLDDIDKNIFSRCQIFEAKFPNGKIEKRIIKI